MPSDVPGQEPEANEERPARKKREPRPKSPVGFMSPPTVVKVETSTGPGEHPDELAARIKRDDDDAAHKRYLSTFTHWVFALMLGPVVIACLIVVAYPGQTYPPETLKLMSTLLTAIVSGGASFFAGKAAGKSS